MNDTLSLADKLNAIVSRRIEAEKALRDYLDDVACPKTRASSSQLHARLEKLRQEEKQIISAIEDAGDYTNRSTLHVVSMCTL